MSDGWFDGWVIEPAARRAGKTHKVVVRFGVASTPQGHRDDDLKGVSHAEQVDAIVQFIEDYRIDLMGCLEYGPLLDRILSKDNRFRTVMGRPSHIGAGGRRVQTAGIVKLPTLGVAQVRRERVWRWNGLPLSHPEILCVERTSKGVFAAYIAHAPSLRQSKGPKSVTEKTRKRVHRKVIKAGARNLKAGIPTVAIMDKNDTSVQEYLDAGWTIVGHHGVDWILVLGGVAVTAAVVREANGQFTDHGAAVVGAARLWLIRKYPECKELPKRRGDR